MAFDSVDGGPAKIAPVTKKNKRARVNSTFERIGVGGEFLSWENVTIFVYGWLDNM